MILKAAVEAFLIRQLRDSSRAKLFSDAALDAKLAQLQPQPFFYTPPRTCQKVGFLIGLKYPSYMFTYDMGLGKSWLLLNLFIQQRRLGLVKKKLLVLVPGVTNIQAWIDQAEEHTPTLHVAGLTGSGREERMEIIRSKADVVVATYNGWLAMLCKLTKDIEDDEDAKGWTLDKKQADEVESYFDMVGWDEFSKLSNHTSMWFKAAKRIAKKYPCRYGLTGTPFGRDPQELWSQFYLIDLGETLGQTIGMFRAAFFKEMKSYWSRWPDYKFDPDKKQQLHQTLCNRSLRYAQEECYDLPPLVPSVRRVIFSDETWAYYDKLIEDLKAAGSRYDLIENAYMLMRQLTSGYLTVKDPEGHDSQIIFDENPKLEATIEWLAEVPPGRKAIIYNIYHRTGDLIEARLKKEKIKYVRLYGKTKNKIEVIERLQRDESVRVGLLSESGAYGLNLQRVNYLGFYESPSEPKMRNQMIARAHRSGQQETVFLTDFCVKNSIDEKILRYIKEGKDLFAAIVEGKETLDAR